VQQDCAQCHSRLKMRLGDRTTLIDAPDWGRHPEFKVTLADPQRPEAVRRVSLSQRPLERNGLIFPHDVHLRPGGGAARQALELGERLDAALAPDCGLCHRADGAGGYRPIRMERDCAGCHSLAFARIGGVLQHLPHGDKQKVWARLSETYGAGAPAAFRQAFSPGGACYGCHTVSWTGGAGADAVAIAPTKLTSRFMPHGGFDHRTPAHSGKGRGAARCADCHAAATSAHSADLLLPGKGECAKCHGQPANHPAAASAQCIECHSYHRPGEATPPAVRRWMSSHPGGAPPRLKPS